MKRIGAILFVLVIYGAIVFYFGWNVWAWLNSYFSVNVVLFSFAWGLIAFSMVLARLNHQLKFFQVIGAYWMAILQYGLILFPLGTIAGFLFPEKIGTIGWIIFLLFLSILLYGSYKAYTPVVRRLSITIPKKESTIEELKVVVASDFHLGLLSNKAHLQRFVRISNEEQPDLVLLVGDLVDDNPIWYVKNGMSEVMKQLTSTYGIYGVLGNHEYYGGKIPQLVEEMKGSNVRMLLDETIEVAKAFYLTGREDLTNKHRKSLEELIPENRNLPWFVMDHTPSNLLVPEKANVDLHVSGHTHLGQMWPNHLFTKRIFELDYGYRKKGAMHAIVSSGFGFWGPPIRIGSQSEIWSIHIMFKNGEF